MACLAKMYTHYRSLEKIFFDQVNNKNNFYLIVVRKVFPATKSPSKDGLKNGDLLAFMT
ncbi:hypothetical protein VSAK1_18324 [Vibrio mediterranei AK1]|nr:hypothetical protein VSAK1_18324 [Vibrio mediterranei AK1]